MAHSAVVDARAVQDFVTCAEQTHMARAERQAPGVLVVRLGPALWDYYHGASRLREQDERFHAESREDGMRLCVRPGAQWDVLAVRGGFAHGHAWDFQFEVR